MKILYAIQGTGNGHLSRARDIVPVIQEQHEIDILISGTQADLELPFPVKYKLKGLGFIFGKNGGVDLYQTYKKSNVKAFLNEIKELPVKEYDLVISDFEPVSSWACYVKGKPCVALSHQSAVLNKHAPQPKRADLMGYSILKKYAPATIKFGFHFSSYDDNIYTPVIRKEVRDMVISNHGHYTVYLPAYDDERILKVLKCFPGIKWQVFSKHNKQAFEEGNISISPINNNDFIASMASAEGILCGAGFETPAEALFMKKKLLVIPMKNQYEQQCNAAALKSMGVPVIKSLKLKHIERIQEWITWGETVEVNYPDNTRRIIQQLFENYSEVKVKVKKEAKLFSVKMLRKKLLGSLLFN